jgi:hypothetical protein
MIRRGLTLRSNHHPRHIFVVLNDPTQNEGRILLVNFTTHRVERDQREEIFTGLDYSLLRHESVIAFSKAGDAAAAKLQNAINDGDFTILPRVPEHTLERIIEAARTSRHLSPARKALLD